MTLSLEVHTIADPDGYGAALALKGDWLVIAIDDGTHVGLGEASHSGDDGVCMARIAELFDLHVRSLTPSLESIRTLQQGPFASASDFVTATAISALDQALHDLTARRAGLPVWRLFAELPSRNHVPVYMTINRALAARDDADYRHAVERVLDLGVRRVKLAPFEAVDAANRDQLGDAERGLGILRMLRESFPDVRLRVDFHERFSPENVIALLPEFDGLDLDWIEVPCPIGPANADIRRRTTIPLAAGEFFFGTEDFVALCGRGWADVVMPDVKHVGGFGPLLDVCNSVRPFAVSVSPHNPSGAVSTLASLHATAVAANAIELELPLHGRGFVPAYQHLLRDGALGLPKAPGWGLTLDSVLNGVGGGGVG